MRTALAWLLLFALLPVWAVLNMIAWFCDEQDWPRVNL